MARTTSPSPSVSDDIEVSGSVVLSVVHVMGAFKSLSLSILEENGIEDPREGEWYPLRSFLSAFDTMMERVGPNTLSAVGRQIVSQAPYPPDVDSVEKALATLDHAYRAEHRGGDVGHFTFVASGSNGGSVVSTTPYPPGFDRGLIYALIQRFEPDGLVEVKKDPRAEDRESGGRSTTYLVRW